MYDELFFVNYYRVYGRKFPWRRKSVSPFTLLVTEMLLRQTLAANVVQVWQELKDEYPNPHAMANANLRHLEKQVHRLGFGKQRSQALKDASRYLVATHSGRVPRALEELLQVPHLGMYSARAILCFAFGERIEIVDTNIQRFISRYNGLDAKADIRRNPHIWAKARAMLPTDESLIKEHNYGLLDFTADICRAQRPKIESCPLAIECWYGKQFRNDL